MTTGILKSVKYEQDRSQAVQIRTPQKPLPPPVSPAAPDDQADSDSTLPADEPTEAPPQVQALINEAQAHVEMMLNQAKTQVDSIKEEAKKRGYEAGYALGKEAALQELQEQTAQLQYMVDAAIAEVNEHLQKSQKEIGRLAVAIAQKIITQELNLNPQIITEIVGDAIKSANITGSCRIRVHPDDYEFLGPLWDTIPSLQPSDRKWELVSDRKVYKGGCIIEVDGGIIDAQIDTQLAQVQQTFDAIAT